MGEYFMKRMEKKEEGSMLNAKGTKIVYWRACIGFEGKATFSYSTDNRHYLALGNKYLLVPGNFRGAMIGIFNYNNHQDAGYVDIDWFKYEIKNTKMPLATRWRN